MENRQHNDRENDDEGGDGGDPTIFAGKTITRCHDFYLVGYIKDPIHYTKWFEIIRNAKENEIIYFHINSEGGSAFTALQLIRCINESKGIVIASVEGMCLSAATFILLTAHKVELSLHSLFLFHNYSGVSIGKGREMHDHINAQYQWSQDLLHTIYKDFLTHSEIESVLENRDIWMNTKEVAERLNKKAAIQKKQEEKQDEKIVKKRKKKDEPTV